MTTEAITPLRQRMIEDMNARKLCAGTQRGHIRACKRFAGFLKRSPETATFEDIRRFQLQPSHDFAAEANDHVVLIGLSVNRDASECGAFDVHDLTPCSVPAEVVPPPNLRER